MNLTRLTEPRDYYLKHVLDSVLPFLVVDSLKRAPGGIMVADLGAGAGFPGFVLARVRPDWEVALIERTQKKAEFLEDTLEALQLTNAYVVPLDAREAAQRVAALKHGCLLVLARAVGRIAAVTQLAAPLLARGGAILHYKGGQPDPDELKEGSRVAHRLKMVQEDPVVYDLPPDAKRSAVLTLNPARHRTHAARRPRIRARRRNRGDKAP
jgi:16S rRNA (guanine527-N7)-methyltransferase